VVASPFFVGGRGPHALERSEPNTMFLVEINWEALVDHLQDTGEAWDLDSAEAWLVDQGFSRHDDGWLCDERALANLDRSEVRSQRRIG
jgi:hypothetical protein